MSTWVAGEELTRSSFAGLDFNKPAGWDIAEIGDDQANLINKHHPDFPIILRRFIIDETMPVASHEGMIEAVAGLYSELHFPTEAEINLKYTHDGSIVTFDTVFAEYSALLNANAKTTILKGLFCNTEKSGQVLYLLHFQGFYSRHEQLIPEINAILGSAEISEEIRPNPYPKSNAGGLLYVMLLLMLVAFFYARNRRIQRSKNPLGRDSEFFWRCPQCRLANHNDQAKCRRCGTVRPENVTARV